MELRTLGSTGLLVSRIGLGMAALGRPGYINLGHGQDLGDDSGEEAMEARARAVLDTAWRSEIRYFDVARSYGLGELFLGNWLTDRGISHENVTVGSKWGYRYTANWKVDALVIAATLAEPFADTVLSGATSKEQLLSNLMCSRIVLDAEARSRLLEIVESPNEYWAKRRTMPWN